MENIFNRNISVFNGKYDMAGRIMSVGDFLKMGNQYYDMIDSIRLIEDKAQRDKIKLTLPMGCVGGVLKRKPQDSIIEESGLICIDIDAKDNPAMMGQWERVKQFISHLPYVAYCSLSVSGRGLFAVIPLKYPQYHRQHFIRLQEDFSASDIVIDAKCSNIGRLRCLSYDKSPCINPDAQPYERLKIERPRPFHPAYDGEDNTLQRIQDKCSAIAEQGIDITSDFDEWTSIGFALASLGEVGRDFYHAVSRFYPRYSEKETDKKFDEVLRARNGSVTLGTFFYICSKYGL